MARPRGRAPPRDPRRSRPMRRGQHHTRRRPQRRARGRADCRQRGKTMAELIAQGDQLSHRWRRTLPEGTPIILGRAGQWAVPWDAHISRRHAELRWDGRRLVATQLPDAANPLFFAASSAASCHAGRALRHRRDELSAHRPAAPTWPPTPRCPSSSNPSAPNTSREIPSATRTTGSRSSAGCRR